MAISKRCLKRAPEIKQPKRRETLIENAEKARLSKQARQLDDHVPLDVPLDDLAVHEPDARKLIAFLKAMEFTTLTRRVADYSQSTPAQIEPDTRLMAGVAVVSGQARGRRRSVRQCRYGHTHGRQGETEPRLRRPMPRAASRRRRMAR